MLSDGGPAKAKRAYLRSRSAVDALKRIVADERIVCGLKDKATLYLAGDEYGHRALEAEAAARAAIGLESEYVGAAGLREHSRRRWRTRDSASGNSGAGA